MTRRGKAASKAQLDAEAIGPDGVLMRSVLVARSIPFARACLAEWKKLDGVDRRLWMSRKSFWVPASVIAPARAALEAAGEGE